jgi:hypothetical protein
MTLLDQCVRLCMAIVVIALISIALYQFSGRASAIEPVTHAVTPTGFAIPQR